jgi:hypothetical protein
MSVGGASGAGGAGASSTSGTGASTGASTTSSATTTSATNGATTTSSGNGATTTSGSATQTAQANATANGASISGQTQTSDGQAATGDPAGLGQQSFTVDADAIAALPAAQQALATQFSIAIVRAQQEEMARAQQPAVTDPSMVQQAYDGLKGLINDTRLNAVTALESFAKQLSERMQTNPEAFADANKLLSALPSNIAIDAVVGEIQAQNPEDAAALKATLDSFVQRQITALEKGEVSPEVAGVAAIAALVAAYKLAPKGELTAVVQSLAKPIANAFAAAKSRLSINKADAETLARYSALDSQGHAVSRHGAHVNTQMLGDRAVHGIDPMTGTQVDGITGRPHTAPRNATGFVSEDAFVQAEHHIRTSQLYGDARDVAMAEGRTHFTVEMSLEDALGPNYLDQVRGVSRVGSAKNPQGSVPTDLTDGRVLAVFKLTPGSEPHLVSMYSVAK